MMPAHFNGHHTLEWIWLPQPNYSIDNLAATSKLLNGRFGCPSQIIELKIWLPHPNDWIENLVAMAKVLNWEFGCHGQTTELRIWLWQWIFPECVWSPRTILYSWIQHWICVPFWTAWHIWTRHISLERGRWELLNGSNNMSIAVVVSCYEQNNVKE